MSLPWSLKTNGILLILYKAGDDPWDGLHPSRCAFFCIIESMFSRVLVAGQGQEQYHPLVVMNDEDLQAVPAPLQVVHNEPPSCVLTSLVA